MPNIEVEKIEYLNILIQKADVYNTSDTPLQKGGNFQLKYKFEVNHFYKLSQQLIRVIVNVTILVMDDNGNELKAGAKFEVDNYFRYPELDKFARSANGKVNVDYQFADTVKGLAYSTTRGVILSKLSGTFLEGTIIPVKMSTDL